MFLRPCKCWTLSSLVIRLECREMRTKLFVLAGLPCAMLHQVFCMLSAWILNRKSTVVWLSTFGSRQKYFALSFHSTDIIVYHKKMLCLPLMFSRRSRLLRRLIFAVRQISVMKASLNLHRNINPKFSATTDCTLLEVSSGDQQSLFTHCGRPNLRRKCPGKNSGLK